MRVHIVKLETSYLWLVDLTHAPLFMLILETILLTNALTLGKQGIAGCQRLYSKLSLAYRTGLA
jgi:hypothetical protein